MVGAQRGAGGKHWAHDRLALDCVLHGSTAQGAATRQLLLQAATQPRATTRRILEPFMKNPAKETAEQRGTNPGGTRRACKRPSTGTSARPKRRQQVTTKPKSKAKRRSKSPPKRTPKPTPPSSSSSSSSSTSTVTKKRKLQGAFSVPAPTTPRAKLAPVSATPTPTGSGLSASAPKQRGRELTQEEIAQLARTTGERESDEAFWDIMGFDVTNQNQQTKQKEPGDRQGRHQPKYFKGKDPRQAGAAPAAPAHPGAHASPSSSSSCRAATFQSTGSGTGNAKASVLREGDQSGTTKTRMGLGGHQTF